MVAPLALGVAACGQEIGQRPLRGADTHPAGYPPVVAVERFGDLIAQRTNGRLRLRNYPGGQLGREEDTLEITIFGGLDLNRVNLALLNPVAPNTVVPALPFLFNSIEHMRRAMDGAPGQQVLDGLRSQGLVGLCFYDSGARSFYNTRRQIRTPADMRGLKIRVQPSDLYVAMVQAMGANPTPIPFGEVYQALIQGVVDGAENNLPSYDDTRHFEVARNISMTGHVMAPEVLVMSLKTWERLSRSDQETVIESARESVPFMRALWDAREQAVHERLLAFGVTMIEDIDRAPFQALMRPVWERFVTTPEQQRLVREIQALG